MAGGGRGISGKASLDITVLRFRCCVGVSFVYNTNHGAARCGSSTGEKRMSKEQILEIHFNNSDLNIKNLSAVSGFTESEVREILRNYYVDFRGREYPSWVEA